MMKKYFLIKSILTAAVCSAQNVGINTAEPTRTLDVNGNMRIRSTEAKPLPNLKETPYRLLSSDKESGNIDYISPVTVDQSASNNVEVIRTIYRSQVANANNTCTCGDITVRLTHRAGVGSTAEFRLNSDKVFTTNGNDPNNLNISYGIKRWSSSPAYSYADNTVKIPKSNYTEFRAMDPQVFNSNSIRFYTIILPKQNNLYRFTISRLDANATEYNYSIICEKFYVQSL